MMTKKELEELDVLCQYINGVKQPCTVVRSHLECIEENERLSLRLWTLKAQVEKLGELLDAVRNQVKAT